MNHYLVHYLISLVTECHHCLWFLKKTYQTVFIKHLKQQAMLSGINLKCNIERNEQILGIYNPTDH